MISRSIDRVARHTPPQVQAEIERGIECNLAYYRHHPGEIAQRLRALDQEWDVERTLETNASALTLLGLLLGTLGRRRWLLLSLAVQTFFLQHALQGWCPPLPLLRRLGVRTRAEIERERCALEAMRREGAAATAEEAARGGDL